MATPRKDFYNSFYGKRIISSFCINKYAIFDSFNEYLNFMKKY